MISALVSRWFWILLIEVATIASNTSIGIGQYLALDPIADGQWYVAALRLTAVHKISTGSGVVVAVVDSGVDESHPALRGSVLPGADFSQSAASSAGDGRADSNGHGTGMASLIVGHQTVLGVAPDARILPVRVTGDAKRTNFAAGIEWAVDHGAKVISISAGSPLPDPREKRAIDEAIQKDVVIVASVGNSPDAKSIQYPARYPGVIAVGATSRNGSRSLVSVTGPEVAISSPGEDISSARPNGRYAIATGTSDAAAIVSGVAALVRSRFPNIDAADVIRRLTATATDAGPQGRDESFGFGIVNPLAALTEPLVSTRQAEDISPTLGQATESAVASPRQTSFSSLGAVILLLVLSVAGLLMVAAIIRRRRRSYNWRR